MKTFKLIVLATVLAASPACKNKDKPKPEPAPMGSNAAGGNTMGGGSNTMGGGSNTMGGGTEGTGSAAAGGTGSAAAGGSGEGSSMAGGSGAPAQTEDPNADWIKLYASHAPAKPADPVELKFGKFKVVKADFDPAKIEGGKATLELDFTSLKSDSDKRDKDISG